MELTAVFTNKHNPNNWRPHELEALQQHFETVNVIGVEDIDKVEPKCVLWRLSAEKTQANQLDACLNKEAKWWGIPQVNRPSGWIHAHAKDHAFRRWLQHTIPVPEWGYVNTVEDMIKLHGKLPVLVRINYANTGDGSLLCKTPSDLITAWQSIPAWYMDAFRRYGPGVDRNIIWAKFINHKYEGLRYSYRIIVSCGEIVTAYARTCPADNWLAITSKFRPEDGETWFALNKRCMDWCNDNEQYIVRAVTCLGLDWQGVDVIFDDNGQPFFLEVQPDYSSGNPRYGDKAPWYNPSYPQLVKFLKDNWDRVQSDLPMYANRWLDKKNHFEVCASTVYQQVKRSNDNE